MQNVFLKLIRIINLSHHTDEGDTKLDFCIFVTHILILFYSILSRFHVYGNSSLLLQLLLLFYSNYYPHYYHSVANIIINMIINISISAI